MTPTAVTAVCGDGVVNFESGETCDDGNALDGDNCPAGCRVEPCQASGETLDAEVIFTTADPDILLIALSVFVKYPDGVVDVPGLAGDPAVINSITSDFFAVTPTDFNYGTTIVLLDPFQIGYGTGTVAAKIKFDRCQGAATPLPADFTCTVTDAVDANVATVTDQVSCSIALVGVATPTATAPAPATQTSTATVASTATPTPTATSVAGSCGNGFLDAGETCESCAADCAVQSCSPGAPTVSFAVDLIPPSGQAPTGATVLLGYHSGLVSIPGSSNDVSVRQRVLPPAPLPQSFSVNDFDYAARVVITRNTTLGHLFTAQFDRCQDAPAPTVADFGCTVEGCAGGAGPIDGCTCAVRVP